MNDKIKEALLKLDPENEDHWTSEGLPRLDVMKDLVGHAVSRSDVTNAAKSFTRENPTIEEASKPGDESSDNKSEEDESEEDESSEGSDEDESSEGSDEDESDEDQPSNDVEAELKASREALNKAQKRYKKASDEMDKKIAERERKQSGQSPAQMVKSFQESQRKQRASVQARQRAMMQAAMEASSDPNY